MAVWSGFSWAPGFGKSIALLLPVVMSQYAIGAEPAAGALSISGENRPAFQKPAPLPGFVLPPVDDAVGPHSSSTAFVLVTDVSFSGNTVVSDADLRKIALPFLGRRLGESDIEELRQKLTRHYIDLGYINSGAVLASEPLQGGVLHFNLVEGRISQVRLRGMGRLDEHYLADRLVPEPELPLNMDALRERYQLLLGDPLFARINTRLVPNIERGKAILEVDVERAHPVQLSVYANNYRAPSVGEKSIGINAQIRNLSGHGDFLALGLQTNPTNVNSDRYSLNWQMPLNSRGTLFNLQVEEGSSAVVEEPLNVLDISSKLSSVELGVTHPFINSLKYKLVLGTSWMDRVNRTWLLNVPFSLSPGIPDGVLKTRTWRGWLDFTARSEEQVVALRLTRNQVTNNLIPPPAPASSSSQPANEYQFWLAQFHAGWKLTDAGMQLAFRGSLQNSSMRLTGLDGMSIGGNGTVRGYRENQLLRDRGVATSLELEVPVIKSAQDALGVTATPFWDWGRGADVGGEPDQLSSLGLSMGVRWHGLSAVMAMARRIRHPSSVDLQRGTLQDRGLHFQLAYQLF